MVLSKNIYIYIHIYCWGCSAHGGRELAIPGSFFYSPKSSLRLPPVTLCHSVSSAECWSCIRCQDSGRNSKVRTGPDGGPPEKKWFNHWLNRDYAAWLYRLSRRLGARQVLTWLGSKLAKFLAKLAKLPGTLVRQLPWCRQRREWIQRTSEKDGHLNHRRSRKPIFMYLNEI